MHDVKVTRRGLLKGAGAAAALAALGGRPSLLMAETQRLARFPEKTDLILLTSRPPQLETPLHYFRELITPNQALFVRWHLANIPTRVDLGTWRLRVGGNVERELSLSMEDLKKLERISYTAVIQCSGNGRSFFEPRVAGGQWGNGAMGNVTWAGVRLKDLLSRAGLKSGSMDVAINGLDSGPLPTVPDFVKGLPMDKALEEDVMIAYEMNGEPLTLLNGFPARLIVPGWYATYWVKSLSDLTVTTRPFEEFWMKPAYRIPDTDCGCIIPGTAPKKTVPITRMTTRSLIVTPPEGTTVKAGSPVEIQGVAFSGGHSVKDVIVSTDGGRTWGQASLGDDRGRYSWIQFTYRWTPGAAGRYTVMAKATNSIGESQPFGGLWNPSGYLWNKVEQHSILVQ